MQKIILFTICPQLQGKLCKIPFSNRMSKKETSYYHVPIMHLLSTYCMQRIMLAIVGKRKMSNIWSQPSVSSSSVYKL